MTDRKNDRAEGKDANPDRTEAPAGKAGFFSDAWWEDRTLPWKILVGTGLAILGLGLLGLFGLIVMLLWNWLMPELFDLKFLSYWQAEGLLVLCWILFKNWNSNNGGDRKRKRQLRRYIHESEAMEGRNER